jgi:glycosyltransferase involved in cell wall biosynthesis
LNGGVRPDVSKAPALTRPLGRADTAKMNRCSPRTGTFPEVTIVIPTRNRWPLLAGAGLAAALAQEEVDHEVVVVDDASTDETPDRLAGLDDDRVRVVRHPERRGVAVARNSGIQAARGEWVAFLDDDDVWAPRKLRLQVDAARAGGAGFAYGGSVWVDEAHRFLFGHNPPDPATLREQLARRNVMWSGCSNVLVRGDLVRRVGGFDETLFQLADWDLWLRLAQESSAACCPEVVVGYTQHRENMLLVDQDDVFREFEYLVKKHRETSRALGVDFDRAWFTRWVATGHLRAGRRRAAARAYLRGIGRTRSFSNVVRAGASLLGEPAVGAGRRVLARVPGWLPPGEQTATEPDWLQHYR